MRKIKDAAADFLANKRIAVTGVSRSGKDHGANTVYVRLRSRDYDVFAVNPNAEEVEGDACYPDVTSIPGGVDAVVIGTRPETADATMRECAELGIEPPNLARLDPAAHEPLPPLHIPGVDDPGSEEPLETPSRS